MKKIFSPISLASFRIALLLCLSLLVQKTIGQTNNYFGTSGTLSGSVWSTNPAGPYTSALNTTGGAILNFQNATTTITGATITVYGVNATANATITTVGGTISNFSNGIVTVDVAGGSTLDFAGNGITASATAGYIKNNTGVWALTGATYGGGFTLNAGTLIARGVNAMGGTATNVLTINGGILASNGSRNFAANKFGGGIVIGGDFTLGASTGLASGTATLTFADPVSLGASTTRTITVGNSASHTFLGIVSGASSNLTVAGGSGTLILAGANTYSGTTTVSSGTLQLNRTGGTTIPATNNVVINGGTLKITTNQTLNNLTIKDGATLTLDMGVVLTINGNLNLETDGIIGGTGTIAYGAAATLKYERVAGTTARTIGKEFPAAAGPTNLTLNGVLTLTLNGPRTVNGVIAFDFSDIVTTSVNLLTIGTAGSFTGQGAQGFINGPLARMTNSTSQFEFPLKATYYQPALIQPASAGANTYVVQYFDASATAISTTFTAPIQAVNGFAYYDITHPTGADGAKLTLNYFLPNGVCSNTADLVVAHFVGGTWIKEGVTPTVAGSTEFGTIETDNFVTTFSPFALGSISAATSALPIELVEFTATQKAQTNHLDWTSATESNAQNFEIQRSQNGQNDWQNIGSVAAAGFSNEPKNYTFEDRQPLAKAFYRLQMVDLDGKTELSKTVFVERKGQLEIIVSPNPTAESAMISWTSESENAIIIETIDIIGRVVSTQKVEQQKGENSRQIDLSDLPAGRFFIRLNGETLPIIKN